MARLGVRVGPAIATDAAAISAIANAARLATRAARSVSARFPRGASAASARPSGPIATSQVRSEGIDNSMNERGR